MKVHLEFVDIKKKPPEEKKMQTENTEAIILGTAKADSEREICLLLFFV